METALKLEDKKVKMEHSADMQMLSLRRPPFKQTLSEPFLGGSPPSEQWTEGF